VYSISFSSSHLSPLSPSVHTLPLCSLSPVLLPPSAVCLLQTAVRYQQGQPKTLNPISWNLDPRPYTPHPTPQTLHPIPYRIPMPNTLHYIPETKTSGKRQPSLAHSKPSPSPSPLTTTPFTPNLFTNVEQPATLDRQQEPPTHFIRLLGGSVRMPHGAEKDALGKDSLGSGGWVGVGEDTLTGGANIV